MAIRERLARQIPGVTKYQNDLAASHSIFGADFRDRGRPEEALVAFAKSIEIRQRLVGIEPTNTHYQEGLANDYSNVAELYVNSRRREEALDAFTAALEIRERLSRGEPMDTELGDDLARTYDHIGQFHHRTNPDEALAAYKRALEIREQLALEHPMNLEFAVYRAGINVNMGHLYADQLDQLQSAISSYSVGLDVLNSVLEGAPQHSIARFFARNGYSGRARAYRTLGQWDNSAADWASATEFAEGDRLNLFRVNRAIALARGNRHREAFQEANNIVVGADSSASKPSPGVLYNAATAMALASVAAFHDNDVDGSQQQFLSDKYATRAVETLQVVADQGLFSTAESREHFDQDSSLNSLRERADFQQLLEQLDMGPCCIDFSVSASLRLASSGTEVGSALSPRLR